MGGVGVPDTISKLYLELATVVPEGTKTARELRLEARVAELEAELAAGPLPWCHECMSEVAIIDEDGCCMACGADAVVPTTEHVARVAELESERDEARTKIAELELRTETADARVVALEVDWHEEARQQVEAAVARVAELEGARDRLAEELEELKWERRKLLRSVGPTACPCCSATQTMLLAMMRSHPSKARCQSCGETFYVKARGYDASKEPLS